MTTGTYAALAQTVMSRPASRGPRLVCVDGPAGSGKSTFAARLASALERQGCTVTVIHMDDLYEGWTGALADAAQRLVDGVLTPLADGRPGAYAVYDWEAEQWGGARDVPVTDVGIAEGCGSASRHVAAMASMCVWVEVAPDLRLRRGVERDGVDMRAHWQRWMVQENKHFLDEDTERRCDLRVDGSSGDVEHYSAP